MANSFSIPEQELGEVADNEQQDSPEMAAPAKLSSLFGGDWEAQNQRLAGQQWAQQDPQSFAKAQQLQRQATLNTLSQLIPSKTAGLSEALGDATAGLGLILGRGSPNAIPEALSFAQMAKSRQQAKQKQAIDNINALGKISNILVDPKIGQQMYQNAKQQHSEQINLQKNEIANQRAAAYMKNLGDLSDHRKAQDSLGAFNALTNQDYKSASSMYHRDMLKVIQRGQDLHAVSARLMAEAQADPNNPKWQTSLAEAQAKLDQNYEQRAGLYNKQVNELKKMGAEQKNNPITGLPEWKYQQSVNGVPSGQPITFTMPEPPKKIDLKSYMGTNMTGNSLLDAKNALETRLNQPLQLESEQEQPTETIPATPVGPLRGPIQQGAPTSQPQGSVPQPQPQKESAPASPKKVSSVKKAASQSPSAGLVPPPPPTEPSPVASQEAVASLTQKIKQLRAANPALTPDQAAMQALSQQGAK